MSTVRREPLQSCLLMPKLPAPSWPLLTSRLPSFLAPSRVGKAMDFLVAVFIGRSSWGLGFGSRCSSLAEVRNFQWTSWCCPVSAALPVPLLELCWWLRSCELSNTVLRSCCCVSTTVRPLPSDQTETSPHVRVSQTPKAAAAGFVVSAFRGLLPPVTDRKTKAAAPRVCCLLMRAPSSPGKTTAPRTGRCERELRQSCGGTLRVGQATPPVGQ
jgi:hypothetical protein